MAQNTLNLRFVSLPVGWDAAELTRLELKDGTTYQQMVTEINNALTFANQLLMSSYYGRLVHVTDEVALEYDEGAVPGFQRITERARGDGRKGTTKGHMLPLVGFDYELNWTFLFLRDARRKQIQRQVNGLIDNVENLFAKQVLTRHFKMEEESGRYYGLGASGVSAPFLNGSAETLTFTPVSVPERSVAFASTHDHFLRLNGITQANLETAVDHLWEHNIDGPYELIVAEADKANWTNTTNVTGYVEKPDPSIAYGDEQSLARVEDIYIGGVKTERGFCRLIASARIPANYWSVTKTYGQDDMNNPLAVRVEDSATLGASLVVEHVSQYPLQGAIPLIFFGVGVNRREGAVLVENDTSGDYATPTISE